MQLNFKPEDTALFLDFDGVICDSVVECFTMSWYAYHHLYLQDKKDTTLVANKKQFRKLRPMVRNSEDNVVIQYIINQRHRIQSQKDFDLLLQDIGQVKLKEFRSCFYDARNLFLAEEKEFWLSLNNIFSPLLYPLQQAADNPGVYILSTKKPLFIEEILKFNRIEWDFPRILEARGRSKEKIITDVLSSAGFSKALFIDDQIDHLRSDGNGAITCYLAEWGYISEEGKKDFSVPHISLEKCARIIACYKNR